MTGVRLSDEVLEDLWQAVVHVAHERVAVLEAAVWALLAEEPDVLERCADGVEEAHKLVGSLDSYARTGGSALALRAATLLEAPEPDLTELVEVVAALRATVDGPT